MSEMFLFDDKKKEFTECSHSSGKDELQKHLLGLGDNRISYKWPFDSSYVT